MTDAARLATYIRMIEDFLAKRMSAQTFSDAFFRTFQEDPGGWGEPLYKALNWVATTCECYAPDAPNSEFDVTEDQLRIDCAERLEELRRLHRDPPR